MSKRPLILLTEDIWEAIEKTYLMIHCSTEIGVPPFFANSLTQTLHSSINLPNKKFLPI
jgi:hypothetical protein